MTIQMDPVSVVLLFGIGVCCGGVGVAWYFKRWFDVIIKQHVAKPGDRPLSVVLPFKRRIDR